MSSSVQPILALLGDPVAGNPTQFIIEHALQHHGLDWRFLSLEVSPERLADAVRGMRAMGFYGGNCTEPHKTAIAAHLDRLSPTAELVGAVNLLLREEESLVGENTEGRGVVQLLQRQMDVAGRRVVLLGAGRMARAIAVELAQAKAAEIVVVNRSEAAGRQLVDLLSGRMEIAASLAPWEGDYAVPAGVDLLIDATAFSGTPDAPRPLVLDNLSPQTWVVDVTFDPPRSWLAHQAAERQCSVLGGLEIFVEQTLVNFQRWTGVEPDRTVLCEAAEEFLEL